MTRSSEMTPRPIDRRTAVKLMAAATAATLATSGITAAEAKQMTTRKVPSSGEEIPVIGMGSSDTFDVGADSASRDGLRGVLQSLVAAGLARVYGETGVGDGELVVAPGSCALIRADGTVSPNLFSVGVPSEQARSFTIIAPIPGANSTVIREIDAAARAALRSLARERVSQS